MSEVKNDIEGNNDNEIVFTPESDEVIDKLKHKSTIVLIIFTIVTFGIYFAH